jgi:endonuclease YncB( thermonuclease family)
MTMKKLSIHSFMLIVMGMVNSAQGDAACLFTNQGEEHVSATIDARTFRLSDDREIRLAGIESFAGNEAPAPLAALIEGRNVRLRGTDDTPDRYGRQSAFVFTDNTDIPVQTELLIRGAVLFSGLINDKSCADALAAAEMTARKLQRGLWAGTDVIKNPERPGDILAATGQFVIVEGKVISARQAGSTWYINFSRRWADGFTATISNRLIATFEAAGIVPRSLENKRIRVRGWVEQRGGPRIAIFKSGQIELAAE